MRVDIDINPETLKWAAIEAAKRDLSRRNFLNLCIENQKRITENSFESMIEDLLSTKTK